jgi:hypothetical protein
LNRLNAFNYIEEKLNFLGFRIGVRGMLNLLDLHVHMETFYLNFCNELFGWQLVNLNTSSPNAAAVDLIDHSNKIVIQVSATATKQKVEAALAGLPEHLAGYRFKFISISKDASSLRNKQFEKPSDLKFDPLDDILDIPAILRYVVAMRAEDQVRIADLVRSELRDSEDFARTPETTSGTISAQQPMHGSISVGLNGTVRESEEQLAKLMADLIIQYSSTGVTGIVAVKLERLRQIEAKLDNHTYRSQWERTSLNSDRLALIDYAKRIERSLRVLAIAGRFRDPTDLADNARKIVHKILEISGVISEPDHPNHIPFMIFTNRYSYSIHAYLYPTRSEIAEIEERLGFRIQGTLGNPQPCSYLPGKYLWMQAFPMMVAAAVWFKAFEDDDEKTAQLCDYDNWLFGHD